MDASIPLQPRSVKDFYTELMGRLDAMGLGTPINTIPSEIPDGVPFELDQENASYDPAAASSLWRALLDAHHAFTTFRSRFVGKVSPVHFFWGSFDLAVTRFSGREAPPHPAGIPALPDWVAREAYSHEVSSLGFWPGNAENPTPSSTATPTRRPTASRTLPSVRTPPSGSMTWASSCSRTTRFGTPPTLTPSCSSSRRRATKLPQISRPGIAQQWSGLAAQTAPATADAGTDGPVPVLITVPASLAAPYLELLQPCPSFA